MQHPHPRPIMPSNPFGIISEHFLPFTPIFHPFRDPRDPIFDPVRQALERVAALLRACRVIDRVSHATPGRANHAAHRARDAADGCPELVIRKLVRRARCVAGKYIEESGVGSWGDAHCAGNASDCACHTFVVVDHDDGCVCLGKCG